jgi:hypothetical protein
LNGVDNCCCCPVDNIGSKLCEADCTTGMLDDAKLCREGTVPVAVVIGVVTGDSRPINNNEDVVDVDDDETIADDDMLDNWENEGAVDDDSVTRPFELDDNVILPELVVDATGCGAALPAEMRRTYRHLDYILSTIKVS